MKNLVHPEYALHRIRKKLGSQATHLELCEELIRQKQIIGGKKFQNARRKRLLESWMSMLRRPLVLEFVNSGMPKPCAV